MSGGNNRAIFDDRERAQAQALLAQVPAPLLDWYDTHARVLPWRSNPSPYRVWISEIMLQQTRVEAVRGYFERFVAALPDIPSLAEVPDDQLLKLWEGLGYYSRARNLKRAAQQVVERYGGVLPADPKALHALPGIGEYSAGSIASIAFGLREPAVDGNVLRVLSRLLACREEITRAQVRRELTALAREMLPQERVGDFNQALMELGALICLPHGAPLCAGCPLAALCTGQQEGIAASLPVRTKKKPQPVQQMTVFLLTTGERICLRRRPLTGLLAGLWELPNTSGALSRSEAAAFLTELGLAPSALTAAGSGRHVFTHVVWEMSLYAAVLPADSPLPDGWQAVSGGELGREIPLPGAFWRLLRNPEASARFSAIFQPSGDSQPL